MVTGPAIASRMLRRKRLTGILLAVLLALTFTLISLRFSVTEVGTKLEYQSYDWRLRRSGPALEGSQVVVVYLNRPTQEAGDTGWPIPRAQYASFLDGILGCGARVVALDILFPFPDKHGPENDQALARALSRHRGGVVLADNFAIEEEANPDPPWWKLSTETTLYAAEEGYRPIDDFADLARLGHAEMVPDIDGIHRSMPLLIDCDGECSPALCLASVMAFRGIGPDQIRIAESEIRVGSGSNTLRLPVDYRSRLLPRSMYDGATKGPRHSFQDVMSLIRGERQSVEGESLADIFGGRIVLLGMGDIVEHRVATPWQVLARGVDVHAAFIESILSGRTASRLPLSEKILIVLLLAFAVALSTWFFRLSTGLVIAAAFIAGYLIVTALMLPLSGAVLPVVAPALGMLLSAVSVASGRLVTGERWQAAEKQEIRKAQMIQQMLLPKEGPGIVGVDLYGALSPCLDVAGDSYDYFPLGPTHLAVSVGDVSGKGLHAAMLMSNIQGRLRAEAGYLKTPAKVMCAVNNAMSAVLEPTSFATMAYAVLNIQDRRLTSCLAGHCPPAVVRADGSVQWLSAGGSPLGMLREATYEQEDVQLEAGDTVAFYTDGITEAEAPSGSFFDEQRLGRILAENRAVDAKKMARRLMDEVDRFTDRAQASDDRTILILKIQPASTHGEIPTADATRGRQEYC